MLTANEARPIAANLAKLPEFLSAARFDHSSSSLAR
jgi:hypothetical protein